MRLVKHPQGCLDCFAMFGLRSGVSKWCMQEYRPRTFKAFGFGADTLAFQSVVEALFKQQALDDEALEGDILDLADSFP